MDCRGARLWVTLLGDPLQVGLAVLVLLESGRPVAGGAVLLVLTDR